MSSAAVVVTTALVASLCVSPAVLGRTGPRHSVPCMRASVACPYSTLGVERGASEQDIRKAFHKKALQYHPDRHATNDTKVAEEKFIEITEAYEQLSNPKSSSVAAPPPSSPTGRPPVRPPRPPGPVGPWVKQPGYGEEAPAPPRPPNAYGQPAQPRPPPRRPGRRASRSPPPGFADDGRYTEWRGPPGHQQSPPPGKWWWTARPVPDLHEPTRVWRSAPPAHTPARPTVTTAWHAPAAAAPRSSGMASGWWRAGWQQGQAREEPAQSWQAPAQGRVHDPTPRSRRPAPPEARHAHMTAHWRFSPQQAQAPPVVGARARTAAAAQAAGQRGQRWQPPEPPRAHTQPARAWRPPTQESSVGRVSTEGWRPHVRPWPGSGAGPAAASPAAASPAAASPAAASPAAASPAAASPTWYTHTDKATSVDEAATPPSSMRRGNSPGFVGFTSDRRNEEQQTRIVNINGREYVEMREV